LSVLLCVYRPLIWVFFFLYVCPVHLTHMISCLYLLLFCENFMPLSGQTLTY
jgi:hypothetical protein